MLQEQKEVKRDYRRIEKKSRIKEKKKAVYQEVKRVNFWF